MIPPVYNPNWPEEIKALYKHDMEQTWDFSLAPHQYNEYRYLLDIYMRAAKSGQRLKILDVGCAQATLALLLAEQGHQVAALDIRQGFLDYAATRYEHGEINFICGDVFDVEIDEDFDLIYANQIVEHILYPVKLVSRLHERLVKGGKLVMTTPNNLYIKNNLPTFSALQPVTDYQHLQNSADGDGHFFAYRPIEMKNVFEEAGLVDVDIKCLDTPWVSGHLKFRYLHRWTPYKLLKRMDQVMRIIPYFADKLGFQILAIGRRPI